jgi:lipoprotein NlpD
VQNVLLIILLNLFLAGCALEGEVYAPVYDVTTIERIPKTGVHRVRADESLYSIAWRYGFDYQELARFNQIKPPYHITVGQLIYLTKHTPSPPRIQSAAMNNKPRSASHYAPPPSIVTEKEPIAKVTAWAWPARGKVIGHFSEQNKGINIGGQEGDPVYATAAGKVVYSGHGLRGYGNLIIIKHNNMFLTAYAHNRYVFVSEGAWVKAGQKIAEMGHTGTQHTMLHFEIRQHGKPVNPLIYLV